MLQLQICKSLKIHPKYFQNPPLPLPIQPPSNNIIQTCQPSRFHQETPHFLSFLTVSRRIPEIFHFIFSDKTLTDINREIKLLKVCFIKQNL